MININIPVNVKMYLAGLMAGDGHVSVKKNGNSAQVNVQINQSYKPTLNKISNLLDMGNIYIHKKSEENLRNFHKQLWLWQLNSNDTTEFLEMILPYLPEKYKQVEHAIKFQKWKNKNTGSGRSLTRDHILYCEKAIQESKMLKEQMITIEDVEKYDLFKKKHYDPYIESGVQNTLDWFDDDYIAKKEIENDNAKEVISPDINIDIIDGMSNSGFAGFFDSEGMVRINENRGSSKLHASIENSNFPILDKYCKTFGGSIGDPKINKNYKITWLWSITASNALNFLEQIHPYILEKREQIKLAIEFQNRRIDGTLTQEKAEYLYRKIMELKHVEYLANGKTRVVPHGSEKMLVKMKEDKTLIEIEVDFHNAVMNDEDIEYDNSYFDNNYRDKNEFINDENQSDLRF